MSVSQDDDARNEAICSAKMDSRQSRQAELQCAGWGARGRGRGQGGRGCNIESVGPWVRGS